MWDDLPKGDQQRLLQQLPVSEVWGMGRQWTTQLQEAGIQTVWDLLQADPALMRKRFSILMERSIRELRGEPCIAMVDIPPPRQEIQSSRSFGRPVSSAEELGEAISFYTVRAASKLRRQGSVAGALRVFIHTSPFQSHLPQYHATRTVALNHPSQDTRVFLQAGRIALAEMYRSGFAYVKAGVHLLEITSADALQADLFTSAEDEARANQLMATLDRVNARFGSGTLQPGVAGLQEPRGWAMKRGNKSPAYTTRWADLARAKLE